VANVGFAELHEPVNTRAGCRVVAADGGTLTTGCGAYGARGQIWDFVRIVKLTGRWHLAARQHLPRCS
jgi:hypothetical protein